LIALALALVASGCAFNTGPKRSNKSYVINGKRYYILASADGYKEKGLASWYGKPFHGRKTASGEIYNMYEFSAAHKTLPLHTWVEVQNLKTKQRMFLRINDRGPFVDGRIIDLSQAAAIELGVHKPGVVQVLVKAVPKAQAKKLATRHRKAAIKENKTQARRNR
jgi:rare lipoprotein A